MIPKIIHYVWLSGDPFPPETQACLDTWKQILPDYELVLWDKERIKEIHNTFMEEAISVKKWAFATDYIRLYAVYTYGGIYLDTDVEVFQSFDRFLQHRLFIGRECAFHGFPTKRYLTSHCFGAEKGHPFLRLCLSYYKNRNFIHESDPALPLNMSFELTISPGILARIAEYIYNYTMDSNYDKYQILNDDIHVYPSYYFDAPMFQPISKVVCVHNAFGSWRPKPSATRNRYKPLPHDYRYYKHCLRVAFDKILRKFHLVYV